MKKTITFLLAIVIVISSYGQSHTVLPNPGPSYVLTGTTTETLLYSIKVEVGLVSPLSEIRLTALWVFTGTGIKYPIVRFSTDSSIMGEAIDTFSTGTNTIQSFRIFDNIFLQNSYTSEAHFGQQVMGNGGIPPLMNTFNVNQTFWIQIWGKLSNSSYTEQLLGVTPEIFN